MGFSQLGKVLGATLVAVGVPAAAGTAWKGFVAVHPAGALLLAAAYELVLAIGALMVRAARKPAERRLDQLGAALDAALSRQAARYRRQYRAYVLNSLRRIDSKGLATVGPFTPELCEVYVDVGLAPRAPGEVPTCALPQDPADPVDRRPLSEFVDCPHPVVLAVLGGPGSGKTTVLRRMAYQAAAAPRGRRRSTPVLLALRDHATAIVRDRSLTLAALLHTVLPDETITEPPLWWTKRLHAGDCLIMLDGLDEIARAEDRTVVSTWIEQQITVYPDNDYVVTSRPLGYEKARINGADVLWVRPFSDEQVTRFLQKWYLAAERRAAGRTGPDVELSAEQGAKDLLDRLATSPALYDLTVNPLLVTMIANVHRYRNALPGSRADLYGEICQVMLYRRQEAKKQQPSIEIPGPDKETLLAHLAFTMMTRKVRDLPRDQLLAALRPHIARLPGAVSGEAFLTDIANNGLLLEREHHLYAFAHHTFGEYLAARAVVTGNHARVIVDNVEDAWWRETTLLYLSLPGVDADPVVRACLSAGSPPALALAFTAAAGRPLAPDLRQRLDDTHAEAFRPDADPCHRRMIAAVLATETLVPWIVTPSGTHVCSQPVTSHLYTLFLRDSGHPAPEGPLKVPPAPAEVVTGVWAGDAQAFSAWLNTLDLGPATYRLPTREEARHLQRKVASSGAVWTRTETDRQPVLWQGDGQPSAYAVTGADLRAAVAGDTATACLRAQLDWAGVRILAIALSRALTHTHSGPRAGGGDRAPSDAVARARIRDLTRALAAAGDLHPDHVHDLDRALEPHMALAHELEPDLALELARCLRLARRRAPRPGGEHGPGGEHRPGLELALGLTLDLAADGDGAGTIDELRAQVMGRALARSLAAIGSAPCASGRDRRAPNPADDFARVFLAQAAVPQDAELVIDLDAAAATARQACAQLSAVPGWTAVVAERLAPAVAPVLERRHTPGNAEWAALRLPALALAAEADALGHRATGDDLRSLAAGLTLLQQRANDRPRPETILLARA
jgi:hypothetical protein